MVVRATTGHRSVKSCATFPVLATALVTLIGCSDSTGPAEKPAVSGAAVRISPDEYTLFGDEPVRLLAEVTNEEGEPVEGARLTWESHNTNVVRVDSLGVARGVSLGTAIVSVTLANGISTAARIAVTGFTSVAAGFNHTCGTTLANGTYCWGANGSGQLGDGSRSSRLAPTRVVGTADFASVYAGHHQTCALTWEAVASCWGTYHWGGTSYSSLIPEPVAGGNSFRHLSLGDGSTCAVTTNQVGYCSGVFPQPVPSGLAVLQVVRGISRSCGVTAAGAIHCWGADVYGDTAATSTLLSDAHAFASVAVGDPITCALTQQGAAYCWRYGQSGTGPVAVAGALTFRSLDAELGTVCGVTTSGDAYCWGANGAGQLGNGTTVPSVLPSKVAGGLTFESVSVGLSHACGLRPSGAIYCWGANVDGQLGDGTTSSSLIPVRVGSPL